MPASSPRDRNRSLTVATLVADKHTRAPAAANVIQHLAAQEVEVGARGYDGRLACARPSACRAVACLARRAAARYGGDRRAWRVIELRRAFEHRVLDVLDPV